MPPKSQQPCDKDKKFIPKNTESGQPPSSLATLSAPSASSKCVACEASPNHPHSTSHSHPKKSESESLAANLKQAQSEPPIIDSSHQPPSSLATPSTPSASSKCVACEASLNHPCSTSCSCSKHPQCTPEPPSNQSSGSDPKKSESKSLPTNAKRSQSKPLIIDSYLPPLSSSQPSSPVAPDSDSDA